jgi:hypothetical protein
MPLPGFGRSRRYGDGEPTGKEGGHAKTILYCLFLCAGLPGGRSGMVSTGFISLLDVGPGHQDREEHARKRQSGRQV